MNKYEFVKELNRTLSSSIFDIDFVEYELWIEDGTNYKQEFVVVHYSGGAIACANNNCNSLTATFRNIGRLLDGGHYEEVEFRERFVKNEHWHLFNFESTKKRYFFNAKKAREHGAEGPWVEDCDGREILDGIIAGSVFKCPKCLYPFWCDEIEEEKS